MTTTPGMIIQYCTRYKIHEFSVFLFVILYNNT